MRRRAFLQKLSAALLPGSLLSAVPARAKTLLELPARHASPLQQPPSDRPPFSIAYLLPDVATEPEQSYAARLLARPDVQKEIRLTARQKAAIEELQEKIQQQQVQQWLVDLEAAKRLPPPERTARMRTLIAASRDWRLRAGVSSGGLNPQIEALLQPDQRQRLRELDLQWRGPLAVNEPSLAATLQLTSGQRERAKAALDAARKAQEKLTTAYAHYLRGYTPSSPTEPAGSGLTRPPEPPPRPDIRKPETLPRPQPTRAQLEESFNLARKEERLARRTAEESVLRQLTPEQRQTWNTLLGKPFRFATEEDLTTSPPR